MNIPPDPGRPDDDGGDEVPPKKTSQSRKLPKKRRIGPKRKGKKQGGLGAPHPQPNNGQEADAAHPGGRAEPPVHPGMPPVGEDELQAQDESTITAPSPPTRARRTAKRKITKAEAELQQKLRYAKRGHRAAVKVSNEVQTKIQKLSDLRERDKQKVSAMGRALTESRRSVKKLLTALENKRMEQKEERKKSAAVLEDTKMSFEEAKKVSYYLYFFLLFPHTFFRPHSSKAERLPAH